MTRWWSTASIRVRLTAWYTGVLALMLIVYAGATYVAVRHEFYEELELEEHVETADVPVTPERRIEQQLDEILVVLVLGLPLIVGLAGVGGYVLARRALTPIDHLAADARRITAERLHERLSVANAHDEIGRLAAVINDTFARLESSFDQLRRKPNTYLRCGRGQCSSNSIWAFDRRQLRCSIRSKQLQRNS